MIKIGENIYYKAFLVNVSTHTIQEINIPTIDPLPFIRSITDEIKATPQQVGTITNSIIVWRDKVKEYFSSERKEQGSIFFHNAYWGGNIIISGKGFSPTEDAPFTIEEMKTLVVFTAAEFLKVPGVEFFADNDLKLKWQPPPVSAYAWFPNPEDPDKNKSNEKP